MALLDFKNYPDTSTPINAENLNNNFNEVISISRENVAQKLSFAVENGFTINCDSSRLIMLVGIRGTISNYCDVMILDTYAAGTSARSHITHLIESNIINVEIVDQKFIFTTTQPEQHASCGILFLVGTNNNINITR